MVQYLHFRILEFPLNRVSPHIVIHSPTNLEKMVCFESTDASTSEIVQRPPTYPSNLIRVCLKIVYP